MPTIRRHKSQSLHSPGNPKPPSGGSGRTGRCPRVTDINASSENLEVTNNGRPMNPSLSEDSVAETALSKKNSDAGLELASVSSIPAGAGPLVATGNDLAIGGRSFLSTGGGGIGGHFGGGPSSSSRRSSFVSGIFSSAVQRRGSGNESAPHTNATVALNSNMLLNDNTSINHKHATKSVTTTTTNAAAAAAAVADATTRPNATTTTTTTTATTTTSSAAALDASEAAAHVPTMLRFGGASALPILLCGQLQKELLVQQHTNRQLSFFTQPTIDSMSYHLISTNSA
uniref:Uncharacterized protein n=1 Tax=Anopheles stephensi TaxID=30069 RepID=A0A182YLF1_ANOST